MLAKVGIGGGRGKRRHGHLTKIKKRVVTLTLVQGPWPDRPGCAAIAARSGPWMLNQVQRDEVFRLARQPVFTTLPFPVSTA
jgi:hypothetical protein